MNKEDLIRIEKIGNSNNCKFNYKYDSKIVEVEDIRKKELFKNKNMHVVYNRIKHIRNPFFVLLVFGSYANKTDTKHSDIDLCLITDSEYVLKEVNSVLRITPVNIDFYNFIYEEFISMIKIKKFNVGNEIIKKNLVLYGLEQFYEVMNYSD